MIYQVGEKYSQFRGEDGVFLTLDDSGIIVLCRMARPTAKEKRAFDRRQPLGIGIGEMGSVMFMTLRFGDLPLMDCTYSPHVTGKCPELQIPSESEGYAMTILLADADSGELLQTRLVGLPHDFSLSVRDSLDCIMNSPEPYQISLNRVYSFSTQQLHTMTKARCTM